MRDKQKQIEQGRSFIEKHERADLKASEVIDFISQVKNSEKGEIDSLYEVLLDAFYMGVAVGARNASRAR